MHRAAQTNTGGPQLPYDLLNATPPKAITVRLDAYTNQIEPNGDALVDKLADVSWMFRKNQSVGKSLGDSFTLGRLCSYCKKPRQGANKCDLNA